MSILSVLAGAERAEIPLVYSRDAVVFPNSIAPVSASTKFAVASVEEAMRGDRLIVVSLLKNITDERKAEIEVETVGTVVRLVQQMRMPDDSLRLLVEGERRVIIKRTVFKKDHLNAVVEYMADDGLPQGAADAAELDAAIRLVKKSFTQYAELAKKVPPELLQSADRAQKPHELCDIVANILNLKPDKKQELLSPAKGLERLEAVEAALESEIELLNFQRRLSAKVKTRIDKNQREYFLQEQLKEINKELGRDDEEDEVGELARKLEDKNPPPEILEKARRELSRLGKLQPFSPEAGVLRVYCEWLVDLPWSNKSPDNKDIEKARQVLDEDHYGMEKPKERILDFIAVRQLSDRARGPILCLVGAPGTGKTSLGKSVARALGRSFVRVSLGGLRDEAEIRGHRKTYVGALPGKIIQGMKKAGTVNPVFLLDEIDKMSSDFHGDPASALLEVLDPEQNSSFTDHYLEVPYDLSNVMFITTANSMNGIPYPLLDRMEVIEVPGYSEYEKLEIAHKFIIPKQISENGLEGADIGFDDKAVFEIIRHYTMESGVRNLEREIAQVMRKLAREALAGGAAAQAEPKAETPRTAAAPGAGAGGSMAEGGAAAAEKPCAPADTGSGSAAGGVPVRPQGWWSARVDEKKIRLYLGQRTRDDDVVFREGRPGVASGLAWTEAGGTLLPVEASIFEGREELILTGNLGDVMKESARIALSLIRSKAGEFGLKAKDFKNRAVHLHVPEGAIPKDGPSAGVTLTACLISAFTGRPLRQDIAMTGEITLTGRVLAVGGVKEKILAAHRNKIGTVLLPRPNAKDLEELPPEVKSEMKFILLDSAEDLVKAVFAGRLSAGKSSPSKAKTAAARPRAAGRRAQTGTGHAASGGHDRPRRKT